MAADLALSAAQTFFAALQNQQLKDFCDMLGYETHLKDLEKSVSTAKNVLKDAEIRDGELSLQQEDYIEKLMDAVDEADDLFEKLLLEKYETGDILPVNPLDKVCSFFSPKNPLIVAYNVSKEIKDIRKNLEDIANNHHKFDLKFDSCPIRKSMPKETQSSVNEFEVIGREGETKAVVDRLLESNEEVGFLSIVGVGGLGKTTLAQLVYNDERIKREFSDYRFWVSVSDHDKERFDVRVILSKILERFDVVSDKSTLQLVQEKFQETLGGKKCLIVLDDIWNENRCKWLELRGFLMRLGRESRILATTRSKESAEIIGKGSTRTYDLEGLSLENSWRLFSMMASVNKQENDIPADCVEIGHKIVEKCCRVPLALKVVGSLLCGKEKGRWDAFERMEVTRINKCDNEIMATLKFSYLHLDSPLKRCFKYCAIFPKDYRLNKEMLIRHWEALGYIVPFQEGQSIQDAGEDYFSILVKRCFFQEVEEDDFGDVKSCKIHDLMHDLAEEVARHEIWRSDYTRGTVGETVRHLGHYKNGVTKKFPFSSKIRSCLMYDTFEGVSLLADNCLRVLKLESYNIEILPETIRNCLHLRSLDLSDCEHLRALPDWIAKLRNLETLDISYCESLNELPKYLSELGKLKHLNFEGCDNFTHMPSRMDKLTCLTSLTKFIVNEGDDSSEDEGDDSSEDRHGELKDLQVLTELRGSITVLVRKYSNNGKKKEEGGNLKRLEHLKDIYIIFEGDNVMESDQEAVMEKLEPHTNLRSLRIDDYDGSIIPKWGRQVDDWATVMPGLVEIELKQCKEMKELPSLSRLRNLKKLAIDEMPNLEYMEDITTADATLKESEFFPSLCYLKLRYLDNLKGWWSDDKGQSCFPCLSELSIIRCPNFVSSLCCPSLESLVLYGCNERLSLSVGNDNNSISMKSDQEALTEKMQPHSNLRSLLIENYNGSIIPKWGRQVDDWATLMPGLVDIELRECKEMKELPVLSRLRYLKKLIIVELPNLEYMEGFTKADGSSKESEFFPSLCHLELRGLGNLKGWWSDDKGQSCFPCLSKLVISRCPNFVSSLCCPSLESLELFRCNEGLSISVGNDNHINPSQDVKLEDVNIDKLEYLRTKQRGRSENESRCGGEDNTPELRFDEDAQQWRSLSHTLRTLTLNSITKEVSLPKGLQYLTNLQQLTIWDWDNLESIPEWIGSLSSLRSLAILRCPKIKTLPSEMSKLTNLNFLDIRGCGRSTRR